MNKLESQYIETPYGDTTECAKFIVDDILTPFSLHNITTVDQQYTLTFWIKSENGSNVTVLGSTLPATTEWMKHIITFVATEVDVAFKFESNDVYYMYHPQLEKGNKATDWTPAPEDVDNSIDSVKESAEEANKTANSNTGRVELCESLIQQLATSISMLVTDGEGGSLMTQTADGGWTFSMADTNDALFGLSNLLNDLQVDVGNTSGTVEVLESAVNRLGDLASYVRIDKSGDQPLIELGTSDREFRLLITNTDIRFTQGSDVPAYISNRALYITKAVVKEELRIGGFVIKRRANGNVGWLWKGEDE